MNIDNWTQALTDALSKFWTEIADFLPNLLATVIIVLIGLFIARMLTHWLARLLDKVGFNALCKKIGLSDLLQKIAINQSPSALVGSLVYFFFLLIILVAGMDTLGLDRFSAILNSFVDYLPKILGTLFIVMLGLFIAHAGKQQIQSSLDKLGVEYGASVARVFQVLVLFVTFSLAIGQLELQNSLINTIFTVLIACLGVALALALGLGSKHIAANMVSGIYAREQLMPGDRLSYGDFTGHVVSVSSVCTIVENDQGERISVPNSTLMTRSFKYTRMSSDAD